MDKVIETMEAEIPDAMVETQLDRVADDFSYRLAMQGMEFESYLKMTGMTMEQFRAVFTPQALRQVKIRLALEKIAELENIAVSDEETDAEYARLAEMYGMEADKVKEVVDAAAVAEDLKVKKAIDLVREKAAITEVEAAADAE